MATGRTKNNKKPIQAKASGRVALDYDATKTTGRRRQPSTRIAAEHVVLPSSGRNKLLATVQDQQRNASLAAWMIRRHLDYVSKFRMQFRSKSPELNALVSRLFSWHAKPRNFDIAERFGREEMFRMFEAEKVCSGDVALVKLDEMKMQAVESDLIAFPRSGKAKSDGKSYEAIPATVTERVGKDTGVVLDPSRPGRIAEFCMCNRGHDGNQLAFDHLEDAANVIFDAYYTRYSSQVRGVSPLSSAINTMQDVYEGMDYALAKAKIHQLFGIAFMRNYAAASDQEEVAGWGGASGLKQGATENASEATEESDDGTKAVSATVQALKPNEIMVVDMEQQGRIDTIESKSPSTEFKNFTELAIRIVLLAFDIPYTAFDSRAASFSGMIADQNLYEVSCRWKREKNMWKRYEYSDWLIEQAWEHEDWNLAKAAKAAGYTRIREIQELVEWIAAGFPWLQKLQEVSGDIKAISVALDNPIDACMRRGTDVFDNIDKIAEVNEYARSKGVALMIGEPGQVAVSDIAPDGDTTKGEKQDEQ